MSGVTTTVDGPLSTAEVDRRSAAARELRVWPAVVIVALFWAFLYANHTVEMSMFARFISRMISYAVVLLVFLGWWFTRRVIPLRDRLLAFVVAVLAGTGACLAADKSMNWFVLFMNSFPVVITVWAAWLVAARSLPHGMRRAGFVAAMVLTFGYYDLLRWDGLDAAQRAEMSWRWQPTKEQTFLASRRRAAAASEVAASTKAWEPEPGDSLEFRGPRRDGVIAGLQLAGDWREHPPQLLWRQRVGPGWSSLIVVDGHLVTQEQRGEQEAVVCYDAATGTEVWSHEDAARFEEGLSGAGPRGTPTFADGRIYALGGKGILNCLAAENGAVVWSHDVTEDAGVAADERPLWGYSVSPLVVDGLVVVFAGGTQDKSIVAYRATDGELAWSCAAGKQSYSSPQVATLQGEKQILMYDDRAVRGIRIADGSQLWEYATGDEQALPMLQPHALEPGNVVVAMEPGAGLLKIHRHGEQWEAASSWTTNRLRPGFNDFVVHRGFIYGLNDGILCCLEETTGKRLWQKGRYGHGQILLLAEQDALLLSSDAGEIILVAVDSKGQKEIGRFQAIQGKTWSSPVLVENKVFLRNGEEMAAYALKLKGTTSGAVARAGVGG